MVDVNQIKDWLQTHYLLSGEYTIHEDLTVDVQGDVVVTNLPKNKNLSVKFGTVTGDFLIKTGLRPHSLKGTPQIVHGSFHIANNNKIDSLIHGPSWVGKSYVVGKNNPIKNLKGVSSHTDILIIHGNHMLDNLDHMPDEIRFFQCEYHEQLPILRLAQVPKSHLKNAWPGLQLILDKYAGKGKSHMLNFALELKKAGYGSNARW